MLPNELSIDDAREIEQFKTWLAKIDVMILSGIDRNKALVVAYREIYYPHVTEVTEEEAISSLVGEMEIERKDREIYKASEKAREEDAELRIYAEDG